MKISCNEQKLVQQIVETDFLTVEIRAIDSILIIKILKQNTDILKRGGFNFVHNGFTIKSVFRLEIAKNSLYIRGSYDTDDENHSIYTFKDIDALELYMTKLIKAISEIERIEKTKYKFKIENNEI